MKKVWIVLAAMLVALCMIIAPASAASYTVTNGALTINDVPSINSGSQVALNVSIESGTSGALGITVNAGSENINLSTGTVTISGISLTSLKIGDKTVSTSSTTQWSANINAPLKIEANINNATPGYVNVSAKADNGYTGSGNIVIGVTGYQTVTSDVKVNVTFTNNSVDKVYEITIPKYVAPSTPRPSSGGSSDTGSGHYTEYPRTVTQDDEYVSFGTSDTVSGMQLPDGTIGEVTLKTVTDATKPEGYHTYKMFEIIVPGYNYASSEPATIYFKIKLSELASAGYEEGDVLVLHGNDDGDTYVELDTYLRSSDGVYAYYSAETYGASPFAIVFEDGASITGAEPIDYPTYVPTDPVYTEPTYVAPTGNPAIPTATQSPLPLLGLIAGLAAAGFVLSRK